MDVTSLAHMNVTEYAVFWSNSSDYQNVTLDDVPPWKGRLLIAYKVILTTLLAVIMTAMGCNTKLKVIWEHLKRPVSFAIGAMGQFVILPLLAFGLAHALSLSRNEAIGILFVSTCPGGVVSNIYTHWMDGDVSLSVSMTIAGTILSFGTMPLNIWLYTRSWTSQGAIVPYANIAITLASILGPVLLGMAINWKSEKVGKIITRTGSISGMVCIMVAIVIQLILFPALFTVGWRVIFLASVLPLAGFTASYCVALLCRRSHKICRTVAIETGCQNIATAMTVIALSFSAEESAQMSLPCIIYAMSMTGWGFVGAIYGLVKRHKRKTKQKYQECTPGTNLELSES